MFGNSLYDRNHSFQSTEEDDECQKQRLRQLQESADYFNCETDKLTEL